MDADTATVFQDAGYGYLELSVGAWLVPAEGDEAFQKRLGELKKLPLPVQAMNGFLPQSGYRITGPDANPDAIVEWGKTAFVRAAACGVDVITFGSGKARRIPDGFGAEAGREQFATLLARLGNAARDAGVRLAIENLNTSETNLGTTLAECLAIVEQSGSPDVFLTHDLYHSLRENEGPEIIAKAGPRIVHCHVAEKNGRAQPGNSGEDFRPYLRALEAIGYRGRFSFECKWEGGIPKMARPAIDAFRAQFE